MGSLDLSVLCQNRGVLGVRGIVPGQGGSPEPGAGFPLCMVIFLLILSLVDVQMGPQFAAAEEQVCFSKYFGSSEDQQVPMLVPIPGRSPGCVLQPAEQWLLPTPGVKLMCLLPALWHRYCASVWGCIFFCHSAGFDQCFFTLGENQKVSNE